MKWLLFAGLGILILGVVLNYFVENTWPVALIILGAGLKIVYIVFKINNKRYRPGKEMSFLAGGLLFFFTGLFLSPYAEMEVLSIPVVLKTIGIALKVVFVILFIRKSKG